MGDRLRLGCAVQKAVSDCERGEICGINNCVAKKNQPARMAFPGCVIFLPPTAAAAKFLFAAYERWCAGREPSPDAAAARRRDGGC